MLHGITKSYSARNLEVFFHWMALTYLDSKSLTFFNVFLQYNNPGDEIDNPSTCLIVVRLHFFSS